MIKILKIQKFFPKRTNIQLTSSNQISSNFNIKQVKNYPPSKKYPPEQPLYETFPTNLSTRQENARVRTLRKP